MTGMTKKTRKTSKSTKSASKTPSRSSGILSSKSPRSAAKTTRKSASSRSGKAAQESISSSSSVNEKSAEKKLSGSSRHESKHPRKNEVWEGYDFDNLPELTPNQIGSFQVVSQDEHSRFTQMITKGRRGRPKKPSNEKEHVHSIRLSDAFLKRLKRRAVERGFTAWQTYAKQVLAEDLDHMA